LSPEQLGWTTDLDPETSLPKLLRQLATYLLERDGRYSLYHKSMSDWLTDPSLRGSLHYVSRQRGHDRLASHCWAEYKRGTHDMSVFSLRYLPTHLIGGGRWKDLATILSDRRFIQAKCGAGLTSELLEDYHQADLMIQEARLTASTS